MTANAAKSPRTRIGAAIAAATAPAPVLVPAKKSTNAIIISDDAMDFVALLKRDFQGPGKTKETPLTSVEAMDLLINVASERRYKMMPAHGTDGKPLYDDEVPVMEKVDLFETTAQKIFAAREKSTRRSHVEKLLAKLASAGYDVSSLKKA